MALRPGRPSAVVTMAASALLMALPGAATAADGTWDRAWGKDVDQGVGTGFEICTVAASCQGGGGGGLGGEMAGPSGVAADAAGNVYVVDQLGHRVEKFDSDGNFQRAWGKDVVSGGTAGFEICTSAASCKTGVSGGAGGEFNFPIGIATDTVGNVYVADTFNNRIQKFDPSGNFFVAWGRGVATGAGVVETCTTQATCQAGSSGGLGGEFVSPPGVATDSTGNVYVADEGNSRVQKLNSAGGFVLAWGRDVNGAGGSGDGEVCATAANCQAGSIGQLGGEFNGAAGLTVDTAGNVYVAESGNDRLQKFNSAGSFQRAWGRNVDSVAGGGAGEICTVAATCQAGANGGLGGEFNGPTGVAVDGTGKVYVADRENNRVQRFDSAGAFELAWGRDTVQGGTTDYEICSAAATCKQGEFGQPGGQFGIPRGIGADGPGNVYVAEELYPRIQKFAAPPPLPPPPAPDTSGPDLDLEAKKKQRLRAPVKITVACSEECDVDATGTVKPKGTAQPHGKRPKAVKLKPASATLAPGERRVLKLKASKQAAKKLAQATRGTAKITVVATDSIGNATQAKRKIKLR